MNMNFTKIVALILSSLLLLSIISNFSLNINVIAETWTQSTTDDFSIGEKYLVNIDDDTITLTNGLVLRWTDIGENSGDYFSIVASAGDVNGDGFNDVIIGAYGNDDAFYKAGKVYLYNGTGSGLDNKESWNKTGEAANDWFGYSIACAGDVNGDSYDDVIVGARFNDDGGSNAGKVYVYRGSVNGLDINPSWTKTGEASSDQFGYRVATAGDVNGDGYDDVIVGARLNDDGGSNAGKAYVYLGSESGLSMNHSWNRNGEAANNEYSYSIATAGDVNSDGYGDVIIGAHKYNTERGKTYLYHGSSNGLNPTENWTNNGEAENDWFGCSVASAGDVNGDGYDDVIVGAYRNDDGGSSAGKAYVYLGSSSGLSAAAIWTEVGENAVDYFGYNVASAGDVNNDGYDEVIISAIYNDDGGPSSGKIYIYFGSRNGSSIYSRWIKIGEASNDQFGFRIATAGDVNGDDYDDVIVGANFNDDGGSAAGKAYVYGLPGVTSSGYIEHGYFISEVFSSSITDYYMNWTRLAWQPYVQPDDTEVKFQIGTSEEGANWSYLGPDGTSNSYYTNAYGQAIYSGQEGKFWRYKVFLYTTDPTITPTITQVIINYEYYEISIPTIHLTSPNGGEDWMKDDYYPITWTAEGDFNSTPICLYYSINNGDDWTAIDEWIENTGHYNWTVPNVETANAMIKVMVTDIYNNTVLDTSDTSFAIDPPPSNPINEEEKIDETKDEQQKPDDSKDNLTENKENSKNQKEGTSISSIIAISEGFVIIIILIMIILFKRKSKINKNKEKTKENKQASLDQFNIEEVKI